MLLRATAYGCLFRCCEQGQAEQAVGVALEARRLDKLEEVITRSADAGRTLKYALKVTQNLVINREFRQQVRGRRGRGWGGQAWGHMRGELRESRGRVPGVGGGGWGRAGYPCQRTDHQQRVPGQLTLGDLPFIIAQNHSLPCKNHFPTASC